MVAVAAAANYLKILNNTQKIWSEWVSDFFWYQLTGVVWDKGRKMGCRCRVVKNPQIILTRTGREVPLIGRTRLGLIARRRRVVRAVSTAVETRAEASVAAIITPATRRVLLTRTARLDVDTPRRCKERTRSSLTAIHGWTGGGMAQSKNIQGATGRPNLTWKKGHLMSAHCLCNVVLQAGWQWQQVSQLWQGPRDDLSQLKLEHIRVPISIR